MDMEPDDVSAEIVHAGVRLWGDLVRDENMLGVREMSRLPGGLERVCLYVMPDVPSWDLGKGT